MGLKILIGAAGVLLGVLITNLAFVWRSKGTLVLDNSDPEESYLFIELTKTDLVGLLRSRYVILKTSKRN